jgi:hypothetical protein
MIVDERIGKILGGCSLFYPSVIEKPQCSCAPAGICAEHLINKRLHHITYLFI